MSRTITNHNGNQWDTIENTHDAKWSQHNNSSTGQCQHTEHHYIHNLSISPCFLPLAVLKSTCCLQNVTGVNPAVLNWSALWSLDWVPFTGWSLLLSVTPRSLLASGFFWCKASQLYSMPSSWHTHKMGTSYLISLSVYLSLSIHPIFLLLNPFGPAPWFTTDTSFFFFFSLVHFLLTWDSVSILRLFPLIFFDNALLHASLSCGILTLIFSHKSPDKTHIYPLLSLCPFTVFFSLLEKYHSSPAWASISAYNYFVSLQE